MRCPCDPRAIAWASHGQRMGKGIGKRDLPAVVIRVFPKLDDALKYIGAKD